MTSVKDILETNPDPSFFDGFTLSDFQWEKIRESNYYKKNPKGRVLDVTGVARTLRAKYRVSNSFGYSLHFQKGFQMCSQFVAQEGKNPRFLTPRETARLQGFPDDYKIPEDGGAFYRQAGNSVCSLVVQEIVKQISKAWNLSD